MIANYLSASFDSMIFCKVRGWYFKPQSDLRRVNTAGYLEIGLSSQMQCLAAIRILSASSSKSNEFFARSSECFLRLSQSLDGLRLTFLDVASKYADTSLRLPNRLTNCVRASFVLIQLLRLLKLKRYLTSKLFIERSCKHIKELTLFYRLQSFQNDPTSMKSQSSLTTQSKKGLCCRIQSDTQASLTGGAIKHPAQIADRGRQSVFTGLKTIVARLTPRMCLANFWISTDICNS